MGLYSRTVGWQRSYDGPCHTNSLLNLHSGDILWEDDVFMCVLGFVEH